MAEQETLAFWLTRQAIVKTPGSYCRLNHSLYCTTFIPEANCVQNCPSVFFHTYTKKLMTFILDQRYKHIEVHMLHIHEPKQMMTRHLHNNLRKPPCDKWPQVLYQHSSRIPACLEIHPLLYSKEEKTSTDGFWGAIATFPISH